MIVSHALVNYNINKFKLQTYGSEYFYDERNLIIHLDPYT